MVHNYQPHPRTKPITPANLILNGLLPVFQDLMAAQNNNRDVNQIMENNPGDENMQPILEFDRSGCVEVPGASGQESTGRAIVCKAKDDTFELITKGDMTRQMLGVEALIWLICSYIAPEDQATAREHFMKTCEYLKRMKLIGDSYQLDFLDPIRSEIASYVDRIIRGVSKTPKELAIAMPSMLIENRFLNNLYQFHPNRYENDFTEKEYIGQGGFGCVYKAKHRLDNVYYAIKVMTVKKDSQRKKILREAQLFASLNHPHVVGYKISWWQYSMVPSECPETGTDGVSTTEDDALEVVDQKDLSKPTISETQISRNLVYPSHSRYNIEEVSVNSNQSTQSWASNVNVIEPSTPPSKFFGGPASSSSDSSDKATTKSFLAKEVEYSRRVSKQKQSTSRIISVKGNDVTGQPTAIDLMRPCYSYLNQNWFETLYIQMELCGISLQKWIANRNKNAIDKLREQPKESGDSSVTAVDFVDGETSLEIFRQILKGVAFVHKNNLIHRDLKPQNIMFVVKEDPSEIQVKIGDFGLATIHESPAVSPVKNSRNARNWLHSEGVGTVWYASPEQKTSGRYDKKSDMYSLGIILFELFYPIGTTKTEKGRCLDNIKKGVLPAELKRKWPDVCKAILRLTSQSPKQRPDAHELLSYSSLFPSKEQKRISSLEAEIERLKEVIRGKDEVIAKLESQSKS